MKVAKQVEAEFSEAVKNHIATVVLDSGLHRHIQCKQPGTFNRHFDVVTWPGHLAISGDMGAFVFTRLKDMFEFFRNPDGRVNYGYWAEKIVATEKDGGHKKFSEDAFRQYIDERLTEWLDGRDIGDREEELRESVRDEVLSRVDDGMHRAVEAAMNFKFEKEYPFAEAWDCSFTEESYYFAWACHAIVWAINQYDATAAARASAPQGVAA